VGWGNSGAPNYDGAMCGCQSIDPSSLFDLCITKGQTLTDSFRYNIFVAGISEMQQYVSCNDVTLD